MLKMNFDTNQEITWCPGCGGYGFLAALKKALVKANKAPKEAVVAYDIGCSANAISFLNVCGFATRHHKGRFHWTGTEHNRAS